MFTLRDLLFGALLPMVLAAAVLVVGWRMTRRRVSARQSRSWSGALAVGLAFAGGYVALFGRPPFPPVDVTDWLLFLALPLVALGTLDATLDWLPQVRLVTLIAVVPWCVWLLMRPLIDRYAAQPNDFVVLFLFVTVLAILWIVVMDGLAARIAAARFSAILLAAAAPSAIVLLMSGSQRLGQIGGLLAATQAAALVVHLVLGPAGVARGTALVFGVLWGGLLLSGHLYAELTATHALLLFAAAWAAWLAALAPRGIGPIPRGVLEVLLVLAAAAPAVVQAWQTFAAALVE